MADTSATMQIERLRSELASFDPAANWSPLVDPAVARLGLSLVGKSLRGASLAGLGLAGLAVPGALSRRRTRPSRTTAAPSTTPPKVSTETPRRQPADVTRKFILGFILPLWLTAGIADWLCHRRTRIERTAGSKEPRLHLLMLGEAALPVIAGLFLEMTSPVLVLMFAAVVAHGATALWDRSYAAKRRSVSPIEQHVHSYLKMVPVMAASFVAVLHWPELRALLGFDDRKPDWTVRLKRRPLPTPAIAALLGAMLVLEVGPYIEEFWRTRKGGA